MPLCFTIHSPQTTSFTQLYLCQPENSI